MPKQREQQGLANANARMCTAQVRYLCPASCMMSVSRKSPASGNASTTSCKTAGISNICAQTDALGVASCLARHATSTEREPPAAAASSLQ
jgi:hypothetical protein